MESGIKEAAVMQESRIQANEMQTGGMQESRTQESRTQENRRQENGRQENRAGSRMQDDRVLPEMRLNQPVQAASEPALRREWMKLEIESRSENEAFARVAVAVFLSRLDPTLEELDDVKTAISEAVTNAVIHGYQNGEGTIYIETGIEDQTVTILIRDEGIGIENIRQAMEPMYTSDKSGERSGMGFSFMEAFMDQVEVKSEPGHGTTVRMKKKIGR